MVRLLRGSVSRVVAIGGAASTREFAAGYKVSGIAHILQSLSAKVCKDLDLAAAGLQPGPTIDTIALDRQEKGQGQVSAIQELEQQGMSVISIIKLEHILEYHGFSLPQSDEETGPWNT